MYFLPLTCRPAAGGVPDRTKESSSPASLISADFFLRLGENLQRHRRRALDAEPGALGLKLAPSADDEALRAARADELLVHVLLSARGRSVGRILNHEVDPPRLAAVGALQAETGCDWSLWAWPGSQATAAAELGPPRRS
eukprot:CAMPEP_0180047760 /NCGR_PEP_ID=MMETSP0984-20121128/37929_1 /TAXON_ID=483367 /ORGANISM="non described non described, Strain CCMP 2436" /LENGTH=139 /DNA_ID=CAMNT_0021976617 /DNA_START=403 /DNA_END=824 /DNA_ORIENTATION=+